MKNGKHVVLYIDDDPDMVESIGLVLESAGYQMVSARTGEEGVRVYKQEQPDLIIVDLMMEEIDSGTNTVKALKLQGNQAPVFMLSSIGDDLHKMVNYSELGLAGVFQKPVDNQKLLSVLAEHLSP